MAILCFFGFPAFSSILILRPIEAFDPDLSNGIYPLFLHKFPSDPRYGDQGHRNIDPKNYYHNFLVFWQNISFVMGMGIFFDTLIRRLIVLERGVLPSKMFLIVPREMLAILAKAKGVSPHFVNQVLNFIRVASIFRLHDTINLNKNQGKKEGVWRIFGDILSKLCLRLGLRLCAISIGFNGLGVF